jgi:hypothetical protein
MSEEVSQGHEQSVRDHPDGEEIVARSQVVLDGDLSKAKLISLILIGREEEALDYKQSYNLSGKVTKDRVEMVRDVVAMANTSGGYIVLGVNENRSGGTLTFEPVGISEEHLKSLDIDKLKPQIESYLNVSVPIKLQIHRLDEHGGRCFAVVYVEESPESPIIMEKDGQYQEKIGKSKDVFRAGDVVVRDGASSRGADQNAVREQISKMRRRERERWTEEILGVRELVERIDQLVGVLSGEVSLPSAGDTIRRASTSPRFEDADYFLGAAGFERMVFGTLRAGSDIDLMWYLNNAGASFYRAVEEAARYEDVAQVSRIRDNELEPLLDNLTVLAITCARYQRPQFLPNVRDAFYRIYERAHTTTFGPSLQQAEIIISWVWETVIKRVYTIGATLLRGGFYNEVPLFIRQEITWDDWYGNEFWARHALKMRARENRLDRRGLCAITEQFIKEREWFYQQYGEREDDVISALCQFDFLQCVHAIHESGRPSAGYPSFGTYYNHRTEPIIGKVIKDDRAREALLPQLSDEELATIIKILDQRADSVSGLLNGWTLNDWRDTEIEAFLDRYPDPVLCVMMDNGSKASCPPQLPSLGTAERTSRGGLAGGLTPGRFREAGRPGPDERIRHDSPRRRLPAQPPETRW